MSSKGMGADQKERFMEKFTEINKQKPQFLRQALELFKV